MIDSIDVSPDGKYLRVTVMQKPFSYLVPVASFGANEQVWMSDGRVVTTLTKRAMREGTSGDDPTGAGADTASRRAFAWMPGGGLAFLNQDPAPRRGRGARAAPADPGASAL